MFFFQSVKIETSCYKTPCKKSELYHFNRRIAMVGLLMISPGNLHFHLIWFVLDHQRNVLPM